MGSNRRRLLNQSTHSSVAASTVRQGPRRRMTLPDAYLGPEARGQATADLGPSTYKADPLRKARRHRPKQAAGIS